jgi:hypothetical protein
MIDIHVTEIGVENLSHIIADLSAYTGYALSVRTVMEKS